MHTNNENNAHGQQQRSSSGGSEWAQSRELALLARLTSLEEDNGGDAGSLPMSSMRAMCITIESCLAGVMRPVSESARTELKDGDDEHVEAGGDGGVLGRGGGVGSALGRDGGVGGVLARDVSMKTAPASGLSDCSEGDPALTVWISSNEP